jgi:hypothetical protein
LGIRRLGRKQIVTRGRIGWDGTHFDNWGQTFAFSGGSTSSGVNAAPSGETSYLSNVPGYDASLLGSSVPGARVRGAGFGRHASASRAERRWAPFFGF